jgi:serine protease Do
MVKKDVPMPAWRGFAARILLAMVASWGAMATPALARSAPESFAGLVGDLSPAVVNVSTTQVLQRSSSNQGASDLPDIPEGSPLDDYLNNFLDQSSNTPRRVTSLGSGFVIDPSGLIVTNYHVIEGADDIQVNLIDGTSLPAKVLGRDEQTDLALLKVTSKTPLPSAKLGDSDKEQVGDWVIAIGNPFGLGGSVTAGIVSARNRDIQAGPYDDFLQTDAPINRGNSGGPLFNMEGEVIGVNSAIYSTTGGSVGIGFAIPSNMVRPVVDQLRKYGEVRRGWLGVRIQPVTSEVAESLAVPGSKGALVAGTTAGGPAAKAGILDGDVILKFDGKDVPDSRTLPRMVADAAIGKTVSVDLWRKGARKTVSAVLQRLPASKDEKPKLASSGSKMVAAKQQQFPSLGLSVDAITDQTRARYRLDGKIQGVVVTDVDIEGPAGDKGLRPGDVIVQLAQQPVRSVADVTKLVSAQTKSGRNAVLLQVYRGGDVSFIGLRLAAK